MGLVVGLVIAAVLVPTVWFADFGVRKVLGYLGYFIIGVCTTVGQRKPI